MIIKRRLRQKFLRKEENRKKDRNITPKKNNPKGKILGVFLLLFLT